MVLQELQDRKAYLEKMIAQSSNQILIMHGQKTEVEHCIQLELNKIADAENSALAISEEPPVE